MKKKDVVLIVIVLLAAAAMLAGSKLLPKTDLSKKTADVTLAPDAIEYVDPTAAPTAEPQIEAEEGQAKEAAMPMAFGPMPPAKTVEAKGHVVITVAGRQYGDPIAMDRDKIITIRQEDGQINKVHITPEKVYMEDSTCEGQDCVGQGEVTLENHSTRVLGAWILCLPNNVTVELVPAE